MKMSKSEALTLCTLASLALGDEDASVYMEQREKAIHKREEVACADAHLLPTERPRFVQQPADRPPAPRAQLCRLRSVWRHRTHVQRTYT
jgi:hypothetical protein